MAIWCSICDKRGHATTDCWYKPNYIKEISREDGKLKKKYALPLLQKSGKATLKSRYDKDERSRSRSSSPQTRQRQSPKPKENHTKITKFSPKRPTNPVGEIEVIDIIKPSTSKSSKCPECLKWDTRMQHTLKYQEVTRSEDKKVIRSLTEENMRLNQLLKKTITERDSFKTLYEVNKKN